MNKCWYLLLPMVTYLLFNSHTYDLIRYLLVALLITSEERQTNINIDLQNQIEIIMRKIL